MSTIKNAAMCLACGVIGVAGAGAATASGAGQEQGGHADG